MTISFETQVMKDTAQALTDLGTEFRDQVTPDIDEVGSGWYQWPLVGLGVKGVVDQALEDLKRGVEAAQHTCEQVGGQVQAAAALYEAHENQ